MSKAFTPVPAGTVGINVTSSSQSASLVAGNGPLQVRIMNNGTATVWVNFGLSTVTAATTTGMPVGPGVTEVITVQNMGATIYAAAIAAGSTGYIYFTPGYGV